MPPKPRTTTSTKGRAAKPRAASSRPRVRASTAAEIDAYGTEPEPIAVDLDAMADDLPGANDVHLFTLNGVDYYIPAIPPANITLKYLRTVRTQGQEAAAGWLLEGMLGADGYEALMNYDGLTPEMLNAVMAAVHKHVMGSTSRGVSGPLD